MSFGSLQLATPEIWHHDAPELTLPSTRMAVPAPCQPACIFPQRMSATVRTEMCSNALVVELDKVAHASVCSIAQVAIKLPTQTRSTGPKFMDYVVADICKHSAKSDWQPPYYITIWCSSPRIVIEPAHRALELLHCAMADVVMTPASPSEEDWQTRCARCHSPCYITGPFFRRI